MPKPPAWSSTALSDFENCPKQYKAVKVDKLYPFRSTPETEWGKVVHKEFEDYLLGRALLRPDLQTHQAFLDAFKAEPGALAGEERIALGTDLKPCAYFGANNIWYRGQVDARKRDSAAGKSHILDHKTGKFKADFDQLKTFAIHEFLTRPEINVCLVEYYWTQTKSVSGETYTRAQLPALLSYFAGKLNRYADAHIWGDFPPRQSGLCRGWCPVNDCEYWTPRRPK